MMVWTDGDTIVEGVRLHYTRAGQGSPVLLLHGVTDAGPCWGRTAEALAESHDVVLLDQRAHGRSEAPECGYALADLAGDAAGIIRHLNIAPATVLGHSLGARVGLTLAALYPDLVAWLVLDDPPMDVNWSSPDQPPDLDVDQMRYRWFTNARTLRALSRDDLIALCKAQSPRWSPDECARWSESKQQVDPRLWEAGGLSIDTSWRHEMPEVACPVLLVRGDVSLGSIVGDAHAAEAMGLLRHGHDVRIAGAGHSIHRDNFDDFISAVAPFLANDGAGR